MLNKASDERKRVGGGWRAGRPQEDPEKTKRWGIVSAKPSEYLVHVRRGRVRTRTSGQGTTCFKLPWDSVAVVPTSLQQLRFKADQVTREKVGVEVAGLAVYRIADPLLAYRLLNFSFPERAQEKLEETLTQMLIGATRRLVANLSVEECLQKRKAALADELLREIAPVVGGEGRVEDATDQGWGVVLDTVEIQEVRILSETVFSAMQEPFRATLDREAREARAEAEKHSALSEARSQREIEQTRIDAEAAVQARRAEVEREEAETRTRNAIHAQELAQQQAEAEIGVHETRAQAWELQAQLEDARHQRELLRRKAQGETDLAVGQQEARVALAMAEASQAAAIAEARILTAKQLPQLAEAVGQRFGEVKITQIGAGESPYSGIVDSVASVLQLVRDG